LIGRSEVAMNQRDGEPGPSAAEDAELARRRRALDRRLDAQRAERNANAAEVAGDLATTRSGMAMGLRLAADLVAGVALGGALGWGFDRLFGTSPWGLMVFLVLGFAAGTLNVMRSAGLVKPGPPGPDERAGGDKKE
jgi:ATP synthase protein I